MISKMNCTKCGKETKLEPDGFCSKHRAIMKARALRRSPVKESTGHHNRPKAGEEAWRYDKDGNPIRFKSNKDKMAYG